MKLYVVLHKAAFSRKLVLSKWLTKLGLPKITTTKKKK